MGGGGTFRADQVEFAFAEENTDGTSPSPVSDNMGSIKGGITLPDVSYEWDPFYGVGREGRGRKDIHQGNQSFRGSIPQIYMLHEGSRSILEMVLGELSGDFVTLAGTNPGVITAVDETTMTDSGENFESGLSVKDGNYAVFSGISVGYIENETGTGNAVVTVWPTPHRNTAAVPSPVSGWNGPQPAVGDEYEIRKTESVGVGNSDKVLVPLQNLNSMSWAVRHRNSTHHGGTSVGSNLTVNYLGGKINRATLSARQGEKLMLALDEVLFRQLTHDSGLPSTSVAKYGAIGTGVTNTKIPAATHPTEEPMVFSQGTLNLFELTNSFAKIRSFSLSIDNGLTEERYLATINAAGGTTVDQVPFELIEGNRVVTLEIEAVMETREYWEHLMRQGQNDALTAKTGFDFRLTFSSPASATELFHIQGPATASPVQLDTASGSDITSNTAQSGASNVGCVITESPHEIPAEGEALITVRLTIDVPNLVMWWADD